MGDQSVYPNARAADNGMAIGASIIAAGISGLAGAIVMGRQNRKERAQERVEKRVSALEARAEEVMAQVNRALEGLSFDRSGTTRARQKQIRKMTISTAAAAEEAVKRARKRAAEIDKEVRNLKVIEGANRLAGEGSDRAAGLSSTLNERAATLVEELRHGLAGLGEKASVQAGVVAGTSAERARTSVQPVKEEAAKLAHEARDLVAHGAELVAEVRQKTPELAERAKVATHDAAVQARELTPELRTRLSEVASKASDRGSEVVARARERAPEVAEQVRARAPEVQEAVASSVSATVHDLQEHAKPLLAEAGAVAARAAEQARLAARDAGQTILPEVQHRADAIGERMSTTTHVIEHKSRQAASAAGQGTKDLGALALWSAVAGGIAYAALLNEEQQRKVREAGKRVWAEIGEVYADIRGYDEEFA